MAVQRFVGALKAANQFSQHDFPLKAKSRQANAVALDAGERRVLTAVNELNAAGVNSLLIICG